MTTGKNRDNADSIGFAMSMAGTCKDGKGIGDHMLWTACEVAHALSSTYVLVDLRGQQAGYRSTGGLLYTQSLRDMEGMV